VPGLPVSHRLRHSQKHDCIVAGDIGCYSLGVLPPYRAMDTCVAMGASIGVGLGLRHVLPDAEARRVVSIIGDSTFVHSGISGLVEMAYNPPATGHVVIVLDNGTTAMTGQQEHPGNRPAARPRAHEQLSIEGHRTAIGIPSVTVIDAYAEPEEFERLLLERLAAPELSVIVARRPCILAAADIRKWEARRPEFRARAAEQRPCASRPPRRIR
jgi:indolepyruvate ferredoxin oxidoreductase alpha subunit